MDRDLYKDNMLSVLEGRHSLFDTSEITKNLTIVEANVSKLLVEDGKCKGIRLKDGTDLNAEAVILTTGTFLGGRVHIGDRS